MIDFNGTKIEKDKLIVNAKVESEIINDVDIYEKVHLKNIKVYTPDNYPDSSKYLIDADNQDSWGNSTSGELVKYDTLYQVESSLGTYYPILFFTVNEDCDNIQYLSDKKTIDINAFRKPDTNINMTVSEFFLDYCQYGDIDQTLESELRESTNLDVQVKLTTIEYNNKQYYVLSSPTGNSYLCWKYLATCGNVDTNDRFISYDSIQDVVVVGGLIENGTTMSYQDYIDINSRAIFAIPVECVTEQKTPILKVTDYEHTFKDLRYNNTPQTAMDFTKEILIVEANVEGSPDITTPCGKDLTKEIFVVYDKKIPYKQAMGYLKSIGGCEPSKEFMDFILRLKSLELSVEACNYQQAAYIWKWFTNNATDPCGVKIKSNCNCHG